MESIYPPERFKATEHKKLSEYFNEFSSSISTNLAATSDSVCDSDMKESYTHILETTHLESVMGMDLEPTVLEFLEQQCSTDHLLCEGEIKKKPINKPQKLTLRGMNFEGLPFTNQKTNLEVLRKKNEIERIRSCEKLIVLNKENFHKPVINEDEDKNLPRDLLPGSDFIINIIFYKPFSYNFLSKNYSEKFRFCHEIQVLGSNKLTELRDRILCSSDSGIQSEVNSPRDDISDLLKAKEKYPSGSFFIDGIFYNDMRSPNAIQYSDQIIEWAKQRIVGTFTSANMDTTKFADLTPRFGYPYLYMHQGDCEHIMVFSDAHILTGNDCLNSQKYPRIYTMNPSPSIMCYMCNLYAARWLIREYSRLPHSSTFFCLKCVESYCYKDGEKIGEFKLYPFFNKFADAFTSKDD